MRGRWCGDILQQSAYQQCVLSWENLKGVRVWVQGISWWGGGIGRNIRLMGERVLLQQPGSTIGKDAQKSTLL